MSPAASAAGGPGDEEPRRIVEDDGAPAELRAAVELITGSRPEGYSKEHARARLKTLLTRRPVSGAYLSGDMLGLPDRAREAPPEGQGPPAEAVSPAPSSVPAPPAPRLPSAPGPRLPSGRRTPNTSVRLTPRKPRARAPLPDTRDDEPEAAQGPSGAAALVVLGAVLGAGLVLALVISGAVSLGPRRPPSPPPSPPPPIAHDEVVAYGEAKALAQSDPAEALRRVERDNARFARGPLAEEREALAVESLRALGRKDEATARAAKFLRDFPASPLAERIRPLAR